MSIQLEVESLRSCEGDSEHCEIAQKIRELDETDPDLLSAYEKEIGPIACRRCVDESDTF